MTRHSFGSPNQFPDGLVVGCLQSLDNGCDQRPTPFSEWKAQVFKSICPKPECRARPSWIVMGVPSVSCRLEICRTRYGTKVVSTGRIRYWYLTYRNGCCNESCAPK